MRFRPRKTLIYLLVAVSIFIVLANLVGFNDKALVEEPQPKFDDFIGPRNPKPVSFEERFKKYEDRTSTSLTRVMTPASSVPAHWPRSQSSLFPDFLKIWKERNFSAYEIPAYPGTNGSENEQIREKYVQRIWKNPRGPGSSVWVAKFDKNQEVTDDRILKQMVYVPKSYRQQLSRRTDRRAKSVPNAAKVKVIYVPSGLSSETPLGTLKFTSEECPVSACNLTMDPIHERTADLRLLQADAFFSQSDPKPPNQIWAIWILESPANTVEFTGSENLINWTATYRWDSTIVTPYAKFVPFSSAAAAAHQRSRPLPRSRVRNYAANKTKMVAWFVSNCNARNGRFEFAQELSKYIPVDIFGACGSIDCPRSEQGSCNQRLNSDYKFYLSFENSNCDHYITEKFFENGLINDIVPIVMGARKSDYAKAAPPGSFIHVDDFRSAKELADHLLKLNASDHLYNQYFRWKGSGEFVNTKFWCRLCALLHDDQRPDMWYTDFQGWWAHEGSCRTGRWTNS